LTERCLDWLPLSALDDARILSTISVVIEHWSARWFVHGHYGASNLTLRGPRHPVTHRKDVWVSFCNAVAIAWPADGGVDIAKHVLNAQKVKADLQSADKSLLQKCAELVGLDLVTAIGSALQLPRAPETQMVSVPNPFLNAGGVEIELDRRGDLPSMRIAIPAFALVPIRKSFVRSLSAPPPNPVSMGSLFKAESLAFSAALGSATISIADLQGLGIGDVVILDTKLDDTISIASQSSGRVIAAARVAQKNGQINLVASDA
jgi:Type III flagellar switch regulator (C-ring) FliN C-term